MLNLGRNVFEQLARLAWVLFILARTCTPVPGWHYINCFCFIILTYKERVCVKWRKPHTPCKHVPPLWFLTSLFQHQYPLWTGNPDACCPSPLSVHPSSGPYWFPALSSILDPPEFLLSLACHGHPPQHSPHGARHFLSHILLSPVSKPPSSRYQPPSLQSRWSGLDQDGTPTVAAQHFSNRLLNSC